VIRYSRRPSCPPFWTRLYASRWPVEDQLTHRPASRAATPDRRSPRDTTEGQGPAPQDRVLKVYAAAAAPTDAADAATIAVTFARAQLSVPYVWGGDGSQLTELPGWRTRVTGGFDRSGLTRAAYAAAGIDIPRTARAQFAAGPQIPAGQLLEPGDLIFYGSSAATVHHVGIYIGDGEMIHAPDVGDVVRVAPFRWPGDDVWGVTRPALEP
jgi:cell wall-associated NlpC family hydrolase